MAERDTPVSNPENIPPERLHPLTKLPNKLAMRESVERAIANPEMAGNFALVAGDVNGLKEINDTQGHPAGDKHLIGCTGALVGSLRGSDEAFVVSHEGGDEVMILLHNVSDDEKLQAIIGRLKSNLSEHSYSMALGGRVHRPADDVDSLLGDADSLMYADKIQAKMDKYNKRQHRIIRAIGWAANRWGVNLRDVPTILEVSNDEGSKPD